MKTMEKRKQRARCSLTPEFKAEIVELCDAAIAASVRRPRTSI
jgi:hypothetical protein